MQVIERAAARDAIIVAAWVAVTTWLRLAIAAARLGRKLRLLEAQPAPAAADRAAEGVRALERMAEGIVWRSETLAALHADALALIAQAEADYAQALAQLLRARTTQQAQTKDAPQPAGDAPLAA
jgi:hypothetical protein